MSQIDTYIAHNERYAAGFSGGGLPAAPAGNTAIVACMDARLLPEAVLGLREGDAHVIRNAGGIVTDDVIRSLAVSQAILGTREVMLVHHTDCGMMKLTDPALKDAIEKKTGARPSFAMGTFRDLEDHVRQSIARLGASPLLMHRDAIRGFVYEVETGRLREVV